RTLTRDRAARAVIAAADTRLRIALGGRDAGRAREDAALAHAAHRLTRAARTLGHVGAARRVVRAADARETRRAGRRAADAAVAAANAVAAPTGRTVGADAARLLRRVVARAAQAMLARVARGGALRIGGAQGFGDRAGRVGEVDRQHGDADARQRTVETGDAEVIPPRRQPVAVAGKPHPRAVVAGAAGDAV